MSLCLDRCDKIMGAQSSSSYEGVKPTKYADGTMIGFSDPFLLHMTPLFALGCSRPLEQDDIGDMDQKDKSVACEKVLDDMWNDELKRPKEDRSLSRSIRRALGWVPYVCLFTQAIYVATTFSAPLLIKAFLSHVEGTNTLNDSLLWLVVALVLVAPVTGCLFRENTMLYARRYAVKLKNALLSMVYNKMVTLSPFGKTKSQGKVENLFNTDVETVSAAGVNLLAIFYSPVQIAVGITLLYYEVGVSVFFVLIVLVVLIPIIGVCGFLFGYFIRKKIAQSDRRIKLTKEVIAGSVVIPHIFLRSSILIFDNEYSSISFSSASINTVHLSPSASLAITYYHYHNHHIKVFE